MKLFTDDSFMWGFGILVIYTQLQNLQGLSIDNHFPSLIRTKRLGELEQDGDAALDVKTQQEDQTEGSQDDNESSGLTTKEFSGESIATKRDRFQQESKRQRHRRLMRERASARERQQRENSLGVRPTRVVHPTRFATRRERRRYLIRLEEARIKKEIERYNQSERAEDHSNSKNAKRLRKRKKLQELRDRKYEVKKTIKQESLDKETGSSLKHVNAYQNSDGSRISETHKHFTKIGARKDEELEQNEIKSSLLPERGNHNANPTQSYRVTGENKIKESRHFGGSSQVIGGGLSKVAINSRPRNMLPLKVSRPRNRVSPKLVSSFHTIRTSLQNTKPRFQPSNPHNSGAKANKRSFMSFPKVIPRVSRATVGKGRPVVGARYSRQAEGVPSPPHTMTHTYDVRRQRSFSTWPTKVKEEMVKTIDPSRASRLIQQTTSAHGDGASGTKTFEKTKETFGTERLQKHMLLSRRVEPSLSREVLGNKRTIGATGIESPGTRWTMGATEVESPVTRRIMGATGMQSPGTRRTMGATGIESPETRQAMEATGIESPETRRTMEATGIESPDTRRTKGATGIESPETRRTMGATGIESPETRRTKGATGIESPGTRRTMGATGIRSPGTRWTMGATGIESPETRRTMEATGIESPETRRTMEATGIESPETRRTMGATGIRSPETRQAMEATGIESPETRRTMEATGIESPETRRTMEATGIRSPGRRRTIGVTGIESPGTRWTMGATEIQSPGTRQTIRIQSPVTRRTMGATGIESPVTRRIMRATGMQSPWTRRTMRTMGIQSPGTRRTMGATGIESPGTRWTMGATEIESPVTRRTMGATARIRSPGTRWTMGATGIQSPVTRRTMGATGIESPGTRWTMGATEVESPVTRRIMGATRIESPETRRTMGATGIQSPVTRRTMGATGIESPETRRTMKATGIQSPVTRRTKGATGIESSGTRRTMGATGIQSPVTRRTIGATGIQLGQRASRMESSFINPTKSLELHLRQTSKTLENNIQQKQDAGVSPRASQVKNEAELRFNPASDEVRSDDLHLLTSFFSNVKTVGNKENSMRDPLSQTKYSTSYLNKVKEESSEDSNDTKRSIVTVHRHRSDNNSSVLGKDEKAVDNPKREAGKAGQDPDDYPEDPSLEIAILEFQRKSIEEEERKLKEDIEGVSGQPRIRQSTMKTLHKSNKKIDNKLKEKFVNVLEDKPQQGSGNNESFEQGRGRGRKAMLMPEISRKITRDAAKEESKGYDEKVVSRETFQISNKTNDWVESVIQSSETGDDVIENNNKTTSAKSGEYNDHLEYMNWEDSKHGSDSGNEETNDRNYQFFTEKKENTNNSRTNDSNSLRNGSRNYQFFTEQNTRISKTNDSEGSNSLRNASMNYQFFTENNKSKGNSEDNGDENRDVPRNGKDGYQYFTENAKDKGKSENENSNGDVVSGNSNYKTLSSRTDGGDVSSGDRSDGREGSNTSSGVNNRGYKEHGTEPSPGERTSVGNKQEYNVNNGDHNEHATDPQRNESAGNTQEHILNNGDNKEYNKQEQYNRDNGNDKEHATEAHGEKRIGNTQEHVVSSGEDEEHATNNHGEKGIPVTEPPGEKSVDNKQEHNINGDNKQHATEATGDTIIDNQQGHNVNNGDEKQHATEAPGEKIIDNKQEYSVNNGDEKQHGTEAPRDKSVDNKQEGSFDLQQKAGKNKEIISALEEHFKDSKTGDHIANNGDRGAETVEQGKYDPNKETSLGSILAQLVFKKDNRTLHTSAEDKNTEKGINFPTKDWSVDKKEENGSPLKIQRGEEFTVKVAQPEHEDKKPIMDNTFMTKVIELKNRVMDAQVNVSRDLRQIVKDYEDKFETLNVEMEMTKDLTHAMADTINSTVRRVLNDSVDTYKRERASFHQTEEKARAIDAIEDKVGANITRNTARVIRSYIPRPSQTLRENKTYQQIIALNEVITKLDGAKILAMDHVNKSFKKSEEVSKSIQNVTRGILNELDSTNKEMEDEITREMRDEWEAKRKLREAVISNYQAARKTSEALHRIRKYLEALENSEKSLRELNNT